MAPVLANTSPSPAISQPLPSGSFSPLHPGLANAALLPRPGSGFILTLGRHPVYLPAVACPCPMPRVGQDQVYLLGGRAPPIPPQRPLLPCRPPGPAWLPFTVVAVGASWASGSTEQPGRKGRGASRAVWRSELPIQLDSEGRGTGSGCQAAGLRPSSSVSFPDSLHKGHDADGPGRGHQRSREADIPRIRQRPEGKRRGCSRRPGEGPLL